MDSLIVTLLLLGSMGTSLETPYWAQTNQYGIMPIATGGLAYFRAHTEYNPEKTFQWHAGTSLAANTTIFLTADAMVDELYAGAKWKCLSLDLGMKHHDEDFMAQSSLGSLSATSGNVVWSGNARTMPGYTANLHQVPIPWTNRKVWLEGSFGDYMTLDDRYVTGALVHNTRFYFTFNVTQRLDFKFGFDHYAMWGGHSLDPAVPDIDLTFGNYLRVITGSSASAAGSAADRNNVIGNQLGGERFRFDYRGDGWKASFQHDIPYDDGSGMGFQNFPDGVNTLWFAWDDKDRWISDIVYEYHHTMCQSGPEHAAVIDGEYTILGGNDNYFNNTVGYVSGWTHFGRTIGDPLIIPKAAEEVEADRPNICTGILSNRLKAHHLGISGKLFRKAPYKLMLTYSRNFGTYDDPLTTSGKPIKQFCSAFQGEIPGIFDIEWMTLCYTLCADFGDVYSNRMGGTVGLRLKFY